MDPIFLSHRMIKAHTDIYIYIQAKHSLIKSLHVSLHQLMQKHIRAGCSSKENLNKTPVQVVDITIHTMAFQRSAPAPGFAAAIYLLLVCTSTTSTEVWLQNIGIGPNRMLSSLQS